METNREYKKLKDIGQLNINFEEFEKHVNSEG